METSDSNGSGPGQDTDPNLEPHPCAGMPMFTAAKMAVGVSQNQGSPLVRL